MRLMLLSLSLTLTCGLWAQDPFQVKVTGRGRPVILIPGLSSSGETWDTTVARYKDRFECHVLTLAGFAGAPRIPAPMLEHVREGIAAYIRKNKLDHPTRLLWRMARAAIAIGIVQTLLIFSVTLLLTGKRF
jgi:pimeloyl-ACP methyl ester carboxylesterase